MSSFSIMKKVLTLMDYQIFSIIECEYDLFVEVSQHVQRSTYSLLS